MASLRDKRPLLRRRGAAAAITSVVLLGVAAFGGSSLASAAESETPDDFVLAPFDEQNWENQADMTWDDWVDIPGTNWNDPSVKPATEALNIALVAVDFPDQPFVITQPKGSDFFGNPQIDPIKRADVPAFYHDFYMQPSELNHGRTVQEYWMEQSRGEYGIDFMDAYGPYEMPRNLFEYGLNEWDQEGACPDDFECDGRMDGDAVTVWKNGMAAEAGVTPDEWCSAKTAELGGAARQCGYDVILRIYAGYDETSIWQEFGPMMFSNKESVPDEWGPPAEIKGDLENWAPTRYVEWTSWRAAAQQWGLSSIRQAESSGTITHEMGHYFFDIGDNNNNPFSHMANPPTPFHRVGAAPWDMYDRGSFNGPGGHHMRWVIPANMGGWSPAGLLLRNKIDMGLMPDENVVTVNSAALAESGTIVDTVTAREVDPGTVGTSGIRVLLDGGDKSAACDINTDPYCDGNEWNDYTLEVVDRMGVDSFLPDSGVLITKNKEVQSEGNSCGYNCFNWVIDANPEDIELVDYYEPTVPGEWATGGEPVMATIADHRQLNDAAFKAGLSSGSKFEWVDEANALHFYVVDLARDDEGVLSYKLAVRSLAGDGAHVRGVSGQDAEAVLVEDDEVAAAALPTTSGRHAQCTFDFTNTGVAADVSGVELPSDITDKVGADVFRLSTGVSGDGWTSQLANELATSADGATFDVPVYVTRAADSSVEATVTLTAVSESDATKSATAECAVSAALFEGEPEPTTPPTSEPEPTDQPVPGDGDGSDEPGAAAPGDDDLASTGFAIGNSIWLAVVVVLVGGSAVAISTVVRRRRQVK